MGIKAISIDDDPVSTLIVKGLCKRFKNIDLEETYNDPFKGAAGIITKRPDLVFLDVEMPEFTGFQILSAIESLPRVIVMSTNPNFKSQALKLKAVAFIQKPADIETFSKVVNEVTKDMKDEQG